MFDMEQMERRYRQMRRATVARSALDVIAMIFLGAGFAFWGVAFWQLLGPPAILSLLSIQAAVLALAFSLAAPLLISMLVPTTPAGQLLQKTQWATVGFWVICASALFLLYQAEQLIELWLSAQPGIAEAHFERRLAFVLVIAFVIVPALAWIQLTPERWVQSVQQAHAVKKLEIQQRGDLAILKAKILRAELLAARTWADLSPQEHAEAFATQRGLFMAASDTMRSIVRTLGLSSDLERSIMGDNEIADALDYVATALDVTPPDLVARGDTAPIVRMRDLPPRESQRVIDQAVDRAAPAHVNTRSGSSESRAASSDQNTPGRTQSDQIYDAIARDLPTVFTAADVSKCMQWTDKREGQRVIRAWLDEGRAKEVRLGRYSLTESEA